MSSIDAAAREAWAQEFRILESSAVPEVERLLNRSLLSDGKRLRPVFAYLMAEALGLEGTQMSPFAIAAEQVHAAFLAHDDVIDEAATRRGKPSLPSISSNARSILAGDLLLARSAAAIAEHGRIGIVLDFAHMVESVVEGEWLQLESRRRIDVESDLLRAISSKKTGALLGWVARVPIRLQERDTADLELASELGDRIGLAFQMMDDVIDFELTSGKPFAQDISEGQMNWVTYELLQANPEASRTIEGLFGKTPLTIDDLSIPAPQLEEAKERVRSKVRVHLTAAREVFKTLSHGRDSAAFEEFLKLMETRKT
jgi:octaprenyl-diphosphate synthase